MINHKRPYVTYTLIVIALFVFLGVHLFGEYTIEGSIVLGAFYKPFILAGEWYRLITETFVHINILHLLMNTMALLSFGKILEPYLGSVKFSILFFGSALCSSLYLFASDGNVLTVGMSGALYGLMACDAYLRIRSGEFRIPQVRKAIFQTYFINLMINFMPGVSWRGHVGGFIGGLLLTMLLFKFDGCESLSKFSLVAIVLFLIGTGVFSYYNREIAEDERFLGTDLVVLKQYESLGFKKHAEKIAINLDEIYDDGGFFLQSLKEGNYGEEN